VRVCAEEKKKKEKLLYASVPHAPHHVPKKRYEYEGIYFIFITFFLRRRTRLLSRGGEKRTDASSYFSVFLLGVTTFSSVIKDRKNEKKKVYLGGF